MRRLRFPLPTTIKVGPHPYRVRTLTEDQVDRHNAEHHHDGEEDDGLFGHADHRHSVLAIGDDMSVSQQQDTMLHETLHAVLVYVGKDDEDLVSCLTPPLLDALQRNPRLVEYLMQKRLVSW